MTSLVYVIKSDSTEKIYIGSTTNCIVKRYKSHLIDFKRYLNNKSKKYLSSFEILKFDDHYIDLLEFLKTDNKKELQRIEGNYIKQFSDICVNRNVAGRNKKQYKIDNIEKINKYQKSYQSSYQKEYRLTHSNYQENYKLKKHRIKILKIGFLAFISILLKLQNKLF